MYDATAEGERKKGKKKKERNGEVDQKACWKLYNCRQGIIYFFLVYLNTQVHPVPPPLGVYRVICRVTASFRPEFREIYANCRARRKRRRRRTWRRTWWRRWVLGEGNNCPSLSSFSYFSFYFPFCFSLSPPPPPPPPLLTIPNPTTPSAASNATVTGGGGDKRVLESAFD